MELAIPGLNDTKLREKPKVFIFLRLVERTNARKVDKREFFINAFLLEPQV